MKSLIIFFILLFISGNTLAEIDILSSGKGIKKFIPGHPRNITDKAEFLPAELGIIKAEGGMFINIPPNKSKGSFRYVGFGPFKMIPASKYKLSCGLQTKYFHNLLILATFFKAGDLKHGNFVDFANITSCSFIKINKEFIFPANADRMILWLGVQADRGKILAAGPAIFIKNLKIQRQTPLTVKSELKSIYGKNLLQIKNFQKFPTGKVNFEAMQLVNRTPKPYKTEIIDSGKGIKALAVSYKKGDYPYVHFLGKTAPVFGNLVRFSCRIRGNGKISLGIWWHRKKIGTYYQHSKMVTLSKQWQDLNVVYACNEPLSDSAAGSITCRGNKVDFQISKINISIIKP